MFNFPRQDPILSLLVGIHPTLADFFARDKKISTLPTKNRLVCYGLNKTYSIYLFNEGYTNHYQTFSLVALQNIG